jgi:hypothetical protein
LIEFRIVSWCLCVIFVAKAAPSNKELQITVLDLP